MIIGVRLILVVTLAIAALPVSASTPSGQHFGPWKVVSISSLSGDGESDDPFATLLQDADGGQLSAVWDGQKLEIKILIENCASGNEFSQSYEIRNSQLLSISKRQFINRLNDDFTTWVAQANLACETDTNVAFDFRRLDAAASNFINRIR